MTIFDEIADTRGRIKKVQDKIEYLEMKADTPRSSVFSDMPKGGGVGNPLEQYIVKKEELTEKLTALKTRLERLWRKAARQMSAVGVERQTRRMMYLRFVCGLQWEKCAVMLNEKYPNCKWNVNKCFRKYRDVLYKIRQAERR